MSKWLYALAGIAIGVVSAKAVSSPKRIRKAPPILLLDYKRPKNFHMGPSKFKGRTI